MIDQVVQAGRTGCEGSVGGRSGLRSTAPTSFSDELLIMTRSVSLWRIQVSRLDAGFQASAGSKATNPCIAGWALLATGTLGTETGWDAPWTLAITALFGLGATVTGTQDAQSAFAIRHCRTGIHQSRTTPSAKSLERKRGRGGTIKAGMRGLSVLIIVLIIAGD
jgi:hypothetical protein